MKLSEKGLNDLHTLMYKLTDHPKVHSEFDLVDVIRDELEYYMFTSDDFTGTVCLTVAEAKGILWDLRDLYKQIYGYEWVKNEPWFNEFKKRIEQAEKQDANY